MAHVILWRFRVAPDHRAAFEAAYGADGDWARLFARGPGFLGTELLRAPDETDEYITIDRWDNAASHAAFLDMFGDAYRALDARMEGLTLAEERIGAFAA